MNTLVSGLFSAAESYGKSNAAFEIILMLLVSFVLGYLFHYFLSKNRTYDDYKEKYDALAEKFQKLEANYQKCCDDLKALQSSPAKSEPQALGIMEKPSKPERKDDLKLVEGIGPKIEQLLYDAGIYTWQQLAETDVKVLQEILDNAGPRYRMHNPASWPLQARMAAEGKFDELEKWQAEHKHGRI